MGFASWQRYCTALEQWASAKLRCGTRTGITEISQSVPPIFGRVAITLGIGPHSSFILAGLWNILLKQPQMVFVGHLGGLRLICSKHRSRDGCRICWREMLVGQVIGGNTTRWFWGRAVWEDFKNLLWNGARERETLKWYVWGGAGEGLSPSSPSPWICCCVEELSW